MIFSSAGYNEAHRPIGGFWYINNRNRSRVFQVPTYRVWVTHPSSNTHFFTISFRRSILGGQEKSPFHSSGGPRPPDNIRDKRFKDIIWLQEQNNVTFKAHVAKRVEPDVRASGPYCTPAPVKAETPSNLYISLFKFISPSTEKDILSI